MSQQDTHAPNFHRALKQLALLTCGATTVHPVDCEGMGYLACDDPHDHGFGGPYKDVVQPHGPEQAVCAGQASVGMHKERRALHEGPQVNVHVPLVIRQIPVHALSQQSAA